MTDRWADRSLDLVTISEDRDAWGAHGEGEWRLGPYRIRLVTIHGLRSYHACFCPTGWLPLRDQYFRRAAEARTWCVEDARAHQRPQEAVPEAQEVRTLGNRDEQRETALAAARRALRGGGVAKKEGRA